MTRQELIDTAMSCATKVTCEGCPYIQRVDCIEHIIIDLVNELTKKEVNE